jgi:hypothetical protein
MARRIRTIEYNGNIYVTSKYGVLKIENTTTPISYSGLPRALDPFLQLGGGGNWFATNTAVSYRIIWGIRDKNGIYVYGSPSTRSVISNAGAANSVQIQFNIPVGGISTNHFFQIYRSRAVAYTAGSPTDPGDELYLVYERNPTNAEILAGQVVFANVTDLTSETILGPPLYTNATQQGIINENNQPPLCTDIALFREHAIYANTAFKQSFRINMVGTTGMIGNTITIAGTTYTGSAAENIAAGQFFVDVAAASIAVRIENTAKSLCKVINGYAPNNRVYAYYVSSFGDVPGKIFIESRVNGDSEWFVIVNNATMSALWSPQLPTANNDNYKSNNDQRKNSIVVSKFQQPEHVPSINRFLIGARNEEVQRVVALRDSVLIFKDNSIWRLTGSSVSNFQISLLDNTVSLIARDSVSVLNNTAFALTNQGFVAVSDNGVQIVSRTIEKDILDDIDKMRSFPIDDSTNAENQTSFSHESDRIYGCTFYSEDLGKRASYIYNASTNSWTRWIINSNCFTVFENRIYYGLDNNFGHILKQRIEYIDFQTRPEFSFSDPTGTVNITAINATNNSITATFTDGVNWDGYYGTLGRGWVLTQGTNKYVVLSWAGPGNPIFLNSVTGIAVGNCTAYRNISLDIMYSPKTMQNPFEMKAFDEMVFDFGTMSAYEFDLFFYNEQDRKDNPINTQFLSSPYTKTVALNDFVRTPLNGDYVQHNQQRTDVMKQKSYGAKLYIRLRHRIAASRFEIKGLAVSVRPTDSIRIAK